MIDLHVHSSISDGSYSPEEVVCRAKTMGLKAFALTDHDSIDGLETAHKVALKVGIELINGIELSVYNGEHKLMHFLGLGLNIHNRQFRKLYEAYRIRREAHTLHVFDALSKMGVDFKLEDAKPYMTGKWLDRQAICKGLVAKGYVASILEGWLKYLDRIPYLEKELCGQEEAIEMIHAAGGKVFLAHFTKPIGLGLFSRSEREARLSKLRDLGLDGIEAYYPSFTKEEQEEAQYYLEHLGLIASGGSDYHGANRIETELGIGEGNLKVPEMLMDPIVSKTLKTA